MQLNYLLVFSLLVACCFSTGRTQPVKGNGTVVTLQRTVSAFHSIKIQGSWNVVLKQGEEISVEVATDENLHEFVTMEVKDSVLIAGNPKNVKFQTELTLNLSLDNLEKITLSGASKIMTPDSFAFQNLKLEINEAATAVLMLTATFIEVQISGAGFAHLTGTAENLVATLSGASTLNAFELNTSMAFISAIGMAKVSVHTTKRLEATVRSLASVQYTGNPEIKKKVLGRGRLVDKNIP